MRGIVVTGANKGIGLAIVTAILREHEDAFVFLGSRDLDRGEAAKEVLGSEHSQWAKRIEVLELDVAKQSSVSAAARKVEKLFGEKTAPLAAVVNNAGIGGEQGLAAALQVNAFGMRRVCEEFVPLIDPSLGRIVNITSAAGPSFVSQCEPKKQRFLTNPQIEWPELKSFMDDCVLLEGDPDKFSAQGLGNGAAYGLSKACANAYTLLLARNYPRLKINACTPGFIETDLTRSFATAQGKSPAEMGMKPPQAGTAAPCFLLFGEVSGTGHYYGSDAKRSPLDRYRAPGTAAYAGS